mgnify:FL=1
MSTAFYDGTKLLSLKDINGDKPEIFIVDSNRTAGKTTFFSRLQVNRFIRKGSKFAVFYRYKDEIKGDISTKFFADIQRLFFKDYFMRHERKEGGVYAEFYLGKINDPEDKGISCGYAIPLNSADKIKRLSHLFSDIDSILFDELQPENNVYVPNELEKFLSIHTSIARGNGEQRRYVPVYMCTNPVSLVNPYYVELGISERMNDETKFLRGDGFVMEKHFNTSASDAQRNSGISKAFSKNKYTDYGSEGIYLNDNSAFVEQPSGQSIYVCTLRYKGKDYALREFTEAGIVYCDDRVDSTFTNRISVTTDDHQTNFVMLRRNDFFLANLRYLFEQGAFRFKNLQCKEVVMQALSYK